MPDINAEYAAAVRRATDAAYRFAVALDEKYSPCDAPRNAKTLDRLNFVTAALVSIGWTAGIRPQPVDE